jgi:predicted nucleotidyltransferase
MKAPPGKEKVLRILEVEAPFLKRKYGVKRIALFGSCARGEQTKKSDLDLLVQLAKPLGLEFIDLALYLEEKLGCKVDLATFESLDRSRTNPRYSHIASEIEGSLTYV